MYGDHQVELVYILYNKCNIYKYYLLYYIGLYLNIWFSLTLCFSVRSAGCYN